MDLKEVNNYVIKHKLGSGAFGEVYLATHSLTGKNVALKIESNENRINHALLETKIYQLLQSHIGIPKVYEYMTTEKYEIMAMELLGDGLDILFRKCFKRFSLKTVLMIADQLITNLEFIHSRNIIHRDVKPQNILIGRDNNSNQLYFVDFGIAKRFRDFKTGEHMEYKDDRRFLGTVRFVSTNMHKGIEPSRRDDMESLGYVLIYLLKGKLPWENVRERNKYLVRRKIGHRKQMITTKELCRGIPREFVSFMDHCKKLTFDEKPDYQYLRNLFRGLFFRNGFKRDFNFDWNSGRSTCPSQVEVEEPKRSNARNALKDMDFINSVKMEDNLNLNNSINDLSSNLVVGKVWRLAIAEGDNLDGEKDIATKKCSNLIKNRNIDGKLEDTFSEKLSKMFIDGIREAASSYDKDSSTVATDGSEVAVMVPENVDSDEILPEILIIDDIRPNDDVSDENHNVCDASTQENDEDDDKLCNVNFFSSCLNHKKSSKYWILFRLFKMKYVYVFCALYFLLDFVDMLHCNYF